MIHYHGLPITPETAAAQVLQAGHGFVSFAEPRNLGLAERLEGSAEIDAAEGCNPIVVALERDAAAELRRLHAEVAQLREKRQPLSKEQRDQIERSNTTQGYHGDYYDAYGIIDDVEAAHNITGEPA